MNEIEGFKLQMCKELRNWLELDESFLAHASI